MAIVPLAYAPIGLVVAAWAALLCGILTKTPSVVGEEIGVVYGAIATAALVGPVEWALVLGAVVAAVFIGVRPEDNVGDRSWFSDHPPDEYDWE